MTLLLIVVAVAAVTVIVLRVVGRVAARLWPDDVWDVPWESEGEGD